MRAAIFTLVACSSVAACSGVQRARVAADAQTQMIGGSKEQVLRRADRQRLRMGRHARLCQTSTSALPGAISDRGCAHVMWYAAGNAVPTASMACDRRGAIVLGLPAQSIDRIGRRLHVVGGRCIGHRTNVWPYCITLI